MNSVVVCSTLSSGVGHALRWHPRRSHYGKLVIWSSHFRPVESQVFFYRKPTTVRDHVHWRSQDFSLS